MVWTPAGMEEKDLTQLVKQAAALRPKS